ncbi:protein artichoke-like [Chironomus tepperi]|uniref:protein artichoke-like n=1 Tax=Chironomus tepperi TaxID=113505 RepID=UPI00391F640B
MSGKLILFLLFIGTCSGIEVDITCEYAVTEGDIFIAGTHYSCNITDQTYLVDSTVGTVSGDHLSGKSEIDVDILSITGENVYEIPDLSGIFSDIKYLSVVGASLVGLQNEHLVPYKQTLVYLVIKTSKLEIIPSNLFADLALLKVVDLRSNQIYYVHPDAFIGRTFTYIIFANNKCKNSGNDVGAYGFDGTTLDAYLEKIRTSICGTLSSDDLISKYLVTKSTLDSDTYSTMELLINSAGKIQSLEEELTTVSTSLDNVTALLSNKTSEITALNSQISDLTTDNAEITSKLANASRVISTLESDILSLNITNEACQQLVGSSNSMIASLTASILDLNSTYEQLKTSYENSNTTITSLELAVTSLNASSLQCKTDFKILNQTYTNLTVYANELELEVTELSLAAEKCLVVNGTCRFTDGTNGYTCIAHDVTVNSTNDTNVDWWGIHDSASRNDDDVTVLVIRELDVLYMPGNIGSTFINIKAITVEKCGLTKLSVGDFAGLDSVIALEIVLNNITAIEAGAFDDLTALETLNLSDNQIKALPLKIFVELPYLISLSLDNNDLTAVKSDFILTSNSIEYFSATNNSLAKIESSFVWKLRNADFISFAGNGCNYKFNVTSGSFLSFYSSILSKC